MRQNGVLTDGRAAEATVATTDEIRVIERPGAINRFKKVSVGTLLGINAGMLTLTADTTITAETHGGKTLLLGEVGGNAQLTVNLPQATGTGTRYRFVVSVVNTSNYVIAVTSDDVFKGNILTNSTGDTPDVTMPWPTAATSDTITLNGATTGGAAIGDWIEVQDIATNQWMVTGITTSSGNEATPFSFSPSNSASSSPSSSPSASVSSSPSASVSSSPSSSVSSSPSSSVSSSVSSSPSTSVSNSPSTSVSSSVSNSPSTSVSNSPSSSPSSSVSSSPSSSASASVSSSPSASPSSSPS